VASAFETKFEMETLAHINETRKASFLSDLVWATPSMSKDEQQFGILPANAPFRNTEFFIYFIPYENGNKNFSLPNQVLLGNISRASISVGLQSSQ
jgi:hypothetical protein